MNPVPDGQGPFPGGRGQGHEPVKPDGAGSCLADVVNPAGGNHIWLDHPIKPVRIILILPLESFGKFCQFIHMPQDLGGKHPIRLCVIDDAHHHGIAQVKIFLGLVMNVGLYNALMGITISLFGLAVSLPKTSLRQSISSQFN